MYRIKTVSGEESVFKTLEEFNAAVRSGVISPDSEIFHSRAERWLEVKSHPHYRAALSWKPEATSGSAKPESSNGVAHHPGRPVSRTNGAKPHTTPQSDGAAPAISTATRPAPQPRHSATRNASAAASDSRQHPSPPSGQPSTMAGNHQPPSSEQQAVPSGQAANGHHSSPSNDHHSAAASTQTSVAAPPKPRPLAPGLRTVVAPPKQANKPTSSAAPAQPPAAPKPVRKQNSAEILFIDLEDEAPAASSPPALSSSSEQPVVSPVAPSRRVASSPPEPAKQPERAQPEAGSERPRASAAGASPAVESRPTAEQPKPRPQGINRAAAPFTIERASEPPAPKSAGPVAPVPETELDFLVAGPSVEPAARKSNGERGPEQEVKPRTDAPALGRSGSSPLIPPLPRSQMLRGSGSRPALSAAPGSAAATAGNSWPIERKAESPFKSSPAAQLAAALASDRPSTRLTSVPTLETAPITLPTMEPMIPERPKSKSGTILTILGVAAVLSSVLFVWKPWQGGAPKQVSSQSTQGATLASKQNPSAPSPKPSAPISSEPVAVRPSTEAATAAAATTATPAGTTRPERAKPDSVTQPDEQIEAAVSPGFQSESIDISSAKVDLSTSASSGSSAIAPTELSRRYAAATAQAKQEFLAKVVGSGFIRIFSVQRLATADGISGAQAAWTGGAEAVRQYRARIVKLESVYEDSVISSQRLRRWPPEEMRAWASRSSLAEPSDAVQVADLMFHQVGEMLALLQSKQGQYEVKGGGFAFKDPTVAQRYNTNRIWVAQRAEAWSSTPESARPLTISQILKALGDGLPAGS